MNDSHQSLRDIQAFPERLREQMVHLSMYASRRSRASGWVTRMCFLIITQLHGVTTTLSQSRSGLSDVQAYPSSSSSHARASPESILQLARRSALKDPSSYVAVSYCWNRGHLAGRPDGSEKALEVVREDLSRRPSTAPIDVLRRSMAYAQAQNVNAIWIDQECIDQSDPVDKENGIQEMDIVYQESGYPIAVLEFGFETQTELDVFASVCGEQGFFNFDPSQIEILDCVLQALTDDDWFKRTWTLQESVSAGVSMTLLLGCPGLRKSLHFGLTPGELEISIWDFQNAMVNVRIGVEEGLAASVWPDSSSAINASNCADVLWNYMPTIIPDDTSGTLKRDASHRQNCNAAQALTFLDDRLNSFFPDRLAILANLCDYECRINTKVLELSNSSFSICALTLAILNGDMSLLGGYRDDHKDQGLRNKDGKFAWFEGSAEDGRAEKSVYQEQDSDLPSNSYGFSWGPKPSACLENISYREDHGAVFRLKPATLSVHGLRVCGVLWDVNRLVKVPKTQRMFASRWQEEVAFQRDEGMHDGAKRQLPLAQDFLWLLLHELVELGFCELGRTMWNHVQPLGRTKGKWILGLEYESMGAPPPYSYDMIFGHLSQSSAANQPDEQEVRSRLSVGHRSLDPDDRYRDRPPLERVLIEQVCTNGSLLCAAPRHHSLPNPQPRVWFEACKMGDQIFTPATNVVDGAVRTIYKNDALSWRILETGRSADGCDIVHCLGRRRGIWRLEGLDRQDYILD